MNAGFKPNIQAMRKRAGFKSAKDYAEYKGMSVNTYTNYEQGVRPISLVLAWEFADDFNCTLDELAGRKPPNSGGDKRFEDPSQEKLNEYYESMNDSARGTLIDAARMMSSASEARIVKDGGKPADDQAQTA